jgi:FixJ family two-component response regulator
MMGDVMSSSNTSRDQPDGAPATMVYVVDDDESMRGAVSMLLRSVGLAVETFASAQEFLAFEMPDVPSCLILDVRLKGQSGLAVQEQIAASRLGLPIVFMTAHGDIAMTVKAMKAGAMDFLAKPFRDQDMLDAVTHALARDQERREASRVVDDLRRCYDSLTAREREVMAFVAAGLMNKQIAGEMNLSEITVKIHRGQAMRKMGARSLAEFVLKAEALGVTAPQSTANPAARGSRS